MISALLIGSRTEEIRKLQNDIRKVIAVSSDEKMGFFVLPPEKNIRGKLEKIDFLHVALIDVTSEIGIEASKAVRQKFPEIQILVIANTMISPAKYLIPEIRPSALLLRPFEEEHEKKILSDFFFFATKPLLRTPEQYYWAKTRDGTQRIPYNAIFCFEAREKKVFIRTKTIEYGTSGTIEKLLEKLPQNFARCHRSFIVNKDYIDRIRLTEGYIYLKGSLMIPISRSYKSMFKEHSNHNESI